jgi:hypothetical protein
MPKPTRPNMKGMDAFFHDADEVVVPVNQQTGTPVKDITSKPASQQASKLVQQGDGKPANQQADEPVPVKGTYYITVEHDLKLEQIRLARRRKGQRIDKSALVREAIDLLPEED